MNASQINTAIIQGRWTNDELDGMINAIKFARAQLGQENKRQLRLGARVKWSSAKNPYGEQGTVEKIAIKYVTVKTAAGLRWKVPANMLTVVETASA